MIAPVWLYPYLLIVHQVSVGLSVLLFFARGMGVLAHAPWPMQPSVRHLSVLIDTVLLLAGVSLWALLSYNPMIHTWLGVKLVLLVLYIVLGSFALKRARTPRLRLGFFISALACVFLMIGVALARHPAGWWTLWS